jgi:hypothetical protein
LGDDGAKEFAGIEHAVGVYGVGYRQGCCEGFAQSMRRSIYIASLIAFALASCARTDKTEPHIFFIKGIDGYFDYRIVTISRGCSYFECGETSTKVLDTYYEFRNINGDNIKVYPTVRCGEEYDCYSKKIDFKFCRNVFLPTQYIERYTISARPAAYYNCESRIVIKGV